MLLLCADRCGVEDLTSIPLVVQLALHPRLVVGKSWARIIGWIALTKSWGPPSPIPCVSRVFFDLSVGNDLTICRCFHNALFCWLWEVISGSSAIILVRPSVSWDRPRQSDATYHIRHYASRLWLVLVVKVSCHVLCGSQYPITERKINESALEIMESLQLEPERPFLLAKHWDRNGRQLLQLSLSR